MREQFIVPKEPILRWKTLLPSFCEPKFLFSLGGTPMYHLFWARNAIYHGIAALGFNLGEVVLVPAFHCTAVVEAILQSGAEVDFYDINLDASPDFDDLKAKINPRTRAVLAIHYFGFSQPIQKIRELCHAHRLFLIEDCAHVLTGTTRDRIMLGHSGDISVFSWRKFLPIYDGGQLIINNPKLKLDLQLKKGSFLFRLKVVKNTLERVLEESGGRFVRFLSFLLKQAFSACRYLALVHRSTAKISRINSYEVEFDINCVDLEMSTVSKRILTRTSLTDVAEKRRRNYAWLINALKGVGGATPLYPNLPDTVCPWIFPLLVPGTKNFQLLLRARGIPATSWSAVIHPMIPLQQFPKARFLYEHLIFLPVHQDLNEQDLVTIVSILRETLNETVRLDAKSFNDRVPLSAVSGR